MADNAFEIRRKHAAASLSCTLGQWPRRLHPQAVNIWAEFGWDPGMNTGKKKDVLHACQLRAVIKHNIDGVQVE